MKITSLRPAWATYLVQGSPGVISEILSQIKQSKTQDNMIFIKADKRKASETGKALSFYII